MTGQLNFQAATQHTNDLLEAAERYRLLKAARRQSAPGNRERQPKPELRVRAVVRWRPLQRRAPVT